MNPQKHYYIAIAGVLGSGKTTAAKLLERELGFVLLEEDVADNAFLPLVYKDPKRWALANQLFYLQSIIRQMKTAQELLHHTNVIQDVPIYQHYFGYTKAHVALGNIIPAEFALYEQLAKIVWRDVPTPDLIIQLEASLPVLRERIRKRSRDFEQDIDEKHLQTLMNLQKEWIAAHPQLPILSVATDHIDLASDKKAQRVFLASVRKRLGME